MKVYRIAVILPIEAATAFVLAKLSGIADLLASEEEIESV